MILSFKTKINGKQTHFPEKIMLSIEQNKLSKEPLNFGIASRNHTPKIHTIRKDEKNRWKVGTMIDFFINARTKDMFRFAPKIPVISIQEIFMTRRGQMLEITISDVNSYIGGNDKYIYYDEQEQLAFNDGFDNYQEFFEYFHSQIIENGKSTGNYWFKGKIIHWTDFKY